MDKDFKVGHIAYHLFKDIDCDYFIYQVKIYKIEKETNRYWFETYKHRYFVESKNIGRKYLHIDKLFNSKEAAEKSILNSVKYEEYRTIEK